MNVIRIILIDDHHAVRRGIRSYLESFSDIQIVGEASTGEETVSQIGQWLPDVVVVDLMLPGGIDGIGVTRQLRTISPHTQVVVLTAQQDNSRVLAALRTGALGYVRKDGAPEALINAIRGATRGQSVLDSAVAGEIFKELSMDSKAKAVLNAKWTCCVCSRTAKPIERLPRRWS